MIKVAILLALLTAACGERTPDEATFPLEQARVLESGQKVYPFHYQWSDETWMLNDATATWHESVKYCPADAVELTADTQVGDPVRIKWPLCKALIADIGRK